jgi:hypothetical protein
LQSALFLAVPGKKKEKRETPRFESQHERKTIKKEEKRGGKPLPFDFQF